MTVAELIEVLQHYDPSTLVVIDSLGLFVIDTLGVFPIADVVDHMTRYAAPDGEHYDCVVLQPSPWP
jgi:hypothetical protein